jgi:hypothetical protein
LLQQQLLQWNFDHQFRLSFTDFQRQTNGEKTSLLKINNYNFQTAQLARCHLNIYILN